MTRTQRLLGGLTFGYANQALVTIVSLWLTAFLLRTLGSRDYGLWLVATQILGYLLLIDLGVVALLPRETAYATGRAGGTHATPELPSLIGHTARLVLWQVPPLIIVAVCVWLSLPVEWHPLQGPLALVFAVFVFSYPFRILQAVLQGLQDLRFLGMVQIGSWIVSTGATVLLALGGLGLYALIGGWVVSQTLPVVVFWQRLRRQFPHVLPERIPQTSWVEAKAYLSKSVWVSVAQIAQVLVYGSDVLIIGKMLGPSAVVPYFCTNKLVTVLGNQPQLVMQSALPGLSELKTSESQSRVLRVTSALTEAMLMVSGALACIVIGVNQGFVHWWVGSDRFGGSLLTGSLVTLMLLRHWNIGTVYAIFAFGHERRISLTTILDGLVTIVASFALIPRVGLVGAPLASLMGVLLVSLPANLAALAHETGESRRRLVASLRHWLWRFLLASGVAWGVSEWVAGGHLFVLVTGTAVLGLLYAGLMLPLALRDPLGPYVRPHLVALRTRLARFVTRDAGT